MIEIDNPLNNPEAREIAARAIKIFSLPQVQAAKRAVKQQWLRRVNDLLTPEGARCVDEYIDEFTFGYVLRAANTDANYPKVATHLFSGPHHWMGLELPGSRCGGSDSPDNSYSFMPIDYGPCYEISGRRYLPAPADTPYTLTDASLTKSLSHLDGSELCIALDGCFKITLDTEPANGRANHIQTKPDCKYVFNRECRSDWRQVAARISIKRLDPPAASPLSDEAIAELAVRMMHEGIAPIHDIIRLCASLEPNVITAPRGTADYGGFVTQKFSLARLMLADDEAFVATLGHGGAAFRNFVAEDFWLRSLEYWNNTSSMNNSQAIPNADGCSTTYVVSLRDPGIHNWINPAGLHQVNIIARWQGLPRDADCAEPTATGRLVNMGDLDSVLPEDMKRVSRDEREAQLSERAMAYGLRFADRVRARG